MSDRIHRYGRVLSPVADPDTGALSALSMDNPCTSCSATCWQMGSASASQTLHIPVNALISGRMGEDVTVSVSRRGLTRVAGLLFGPTLLILTLLAIASGTGMQGTELGGLAMVLLPAALWFSRQLLKSRAASWLDLDTHAKVG